MPHKATSIYEYCFVKFICDLSVSYFEKMKKLNNQK